jgi:hypothetical protein
MRGNTERWVDIKKKNNYKVNNYLSVTKIAGEYNLLIIFLDQDYTEEDE